MEAGPKTVTFTNDKEREAFYGVTAAALRGWRKKGLNAGDVFPENNPVAVVDWYRRNYQKSAPQSILLAAAKFTTPDKKRKGKSPEFEGLDMGGLTDQLDRARRVGAFYGKLLEKALQDGNKEEAELYREPWLKSQARAESLEKTAVKLARDRRELIDRNSVTTAWTNMHGHLPRALSRALLAAKPDEVTSEDWGRITREALDKAMELMPTILPEILAGSPATDETEQPETETPT